MNPLPPVHVHTNGQTTGDSSLSTHNDEEENRSVNSANYSHYSHSDMSLPNPEEHSLPIPEDYYATTNANKANAANNNNSNTPSKLQFKQHQQQGMSTPTPRHSNRSRTHSNSEAVANALRPATPGIANPSTINGSNNSNHDGLRTNELMIRITTRSIMSWSPQVIHADGSSHTMTIDLPEEFSHRNRTIVITQQGWQDLYHIIATAVAKNTSESILLFWFSGFVLMITALVMLFGLVDGFVSRLLILFGALLATSLIGFAHAVVRRIRVHVAVRRCVEECFYDAEAAAVATAAAANPSLAMDIELQQRQNNNNSTESSGNDVLDRSMGGVLDNLQELEDPATGDTGGGFGRAMRQRLNSLTSQHSLTNITPGTNDNNPIAVGNRRRLNTADSMATTSSNMIFDEEGPRHNRAISRDGMYCVNWKWEYLGMDAVVKIAWE